MGLLVDIQKASLDENASIGPILLKLRLLAAKLDSEPLEQWVKFESEGYPPDVSLPDYRRLGVSYQASFAGPFGSGVRNAPVPPHLIREHAGEDWLETPLRSSISAIDDLLKKRENGGNLRSTNASNLILLLQGNMYPDFNCIDVQGHISSSEVAAIAHAVRSRVLELTIELEKAFPASADIEISANQPSISTAQAKEVDKISQKIIYGPYTEIHNSGDGAQISVNNTVGDQSSLTTALTDAGIDSEDATSLANIIASEEPSKEGEALGPKAQAWLVDNLKKAIDGTWKIGAGVATSLISQAAANYYGLS